MTQAALFAALGDPVRLAIVSRLSGRGPLSTIQLKDGTSVSRQAVTKHLRLLEGVGLVSSERAGRDRLWRLSARRLDEAEKFLARVSARWDQRIERLRAFVEDPKS